MKLEFSSLKDQLVNRHPSMLDVFHIAQKVGSNNMFVAGGFARTFCSENSNIEGDIDLFLSEDGYKEIVKLQKGNGEVIVNQFGSERWFPDNSSSFYYDIIRIKDFYHGLWKCKSIVDVLNQFDITANAIAFDLFNGNVYNPVEGIRDAKLKIIKAVRFDFPEMLVSERIAISRVSVLWFRYNHYSHKLNYDIEPLTKSWMVDNFHRITEIDLFTKFFFKPIVVL